MKCKIGFFLVFVMLVGLLGCKQENAAPEKLIGVWENSGQYTDGREFVETMTLKEDGSAEIHLEYMGSDYATLTGTYETEDGTLTVHIADAKEPYDKVYQYRLTGEELQLTGNGKTVTYSRVH